MNALLVNRSLSLRRKRAGVALECDTNGAILILGIAFGAALVAALYYLVCLAQAVLWREAAQQAADAAAFENALWHARGMNTIAGLNILMSMLSSIIVTWRMTMLAMAFATLTVEAGQQSGSASSESSTSLTTLVGMLKADADVAATISLLAAGLGEAQSAVALYTPSLATLVRSPDRNLEGDTDAVVTMSASSIPFEQAEAGYAIIVEGAGNDERPGQLADGLAAEATVHRLAEPIGLPVARESLRAGCPGPAPNPWATPTWFCASASRAVDRVKAGAWQLAAAALRRSSHSDDELLRVVNAHTADYTVASASASSAQSLSQALRAIVESDSPESRFGSAVRVWPPAANGNFYLRSAAVVLPRPRVTARTEHAAVLWAHAEAYFDCDSDWRRCNVNAMWRLSWRARLRRVRPFARLMQEAGRGSLTAVEDEWQSSIKRWLKRRTDGARSATTSERLGQALLMPEIQVRDTGAYARLRDARSSREATSGILESISHEWKRSSVIH